MSTDLQAAVDRYWQVKQSQGEAVDAAGTIIGGTAGSVRGGQHFMPIARLIAERFLQAGYPATSILVGSGDGLSLPGYFRPQKQWDVLVVHDGVLVAAVELKGLGAPKFGNNYNNRIEEALGNSADLRRAAFEGLCGRENTWLGYFFMMEDALGSRRPVSERRGPFPREPIWNVDTNSSYQGRCAIFCERLMAERVYDTVCYIVSAPGEPIQEPVDSVNWQHFCAAIEGRVAYLRGLGLP